MKMKKPLNLIPVIPLAFSYSYILSLYYHNIGELTLRVLLAPLLIVGIAVLVLYGVLMVLLKNSIKSNLFLSIFSITVFSYGDIVPIVRSWKFFTEVFRIESGNVVAGCSIAVLIILYFCLSRTKSALSALYSYMLIAGIFSVFMPLFRIGWYEVKDRPHKTISSRFRVPAQTGKPINTSTLPDIYYIIPDSYSAPSVFSKYFGYDNSQFAEFLKGKGFSVIGNATSNYPKTYLSVASALNMEYLDYLSVYKNSSDETLITPVIQNNAVVLFLKSIGYTYYHIGSWWGPTQYNWLAKRNYNLDLTNPAGLDAFSSIILRSSLIYPFLPKKFLDSVMTESVDDKRKRILYEFNTLDEISSLPGPKFIFAHIIAPHGPNVFDAECKYIGENDWIGVTDEAGYTDQVQCINRMLKDAITAILTKSKQPPVILLQSDEGAPFLANLLTPPDNWKEASDDLLKEKFPVLSAYYIQGRNLSGIPDDMTPVNSFRFIFNTVFATNIPLLGNRSYVNLDMNHRYEFQDVTDRVKE